MTLGDSTIWTADTLAAKPPSTKFTAVRHQTLDLGHWALDLGHWALDLGHWTLDLGHCLSEVSPVAKQIILTTTLPKWLRADQQ